MRRPKRRITFQHLVDSPCCVTRPISTAPTCVVCPIFCGSSWLPLNRNTVLRAITLKFGSCESVPIKLSVNPSLRYSLFGSAVAFTKGSTASDVTFGASDLPRSKYAPAAPATLSTTTAMPAIAYLLELLETAAAGIEPELAAAADVLAEDALAEVAALPERPESRSRFSRAKSLRRSAAL